MTAIDWNQWRNDYDRMSFHDHQRFNAAVAEQHPDQRSWDATACAKFLAERKPRTVVEIGGWDGALANIMLNQFPGIDTWVNYDITPNVPQVCGHHAYQRIVLDNWPWTFNLTADALVSSHVFEHMRAGEIDELATRWHVDHLYIDCPIGTDNPDWRNYPGTHILEIGAETLLHRLGAHGFWLTHFQPGFIAYMDRLDGH